MKLTSKLCAVALCLLVAQHAQSGAEARAPGLLSAFFGLDNGLPFIANRLCLGASGEDGMPVVFSHTIDPGTLQAEDFKVLTQSGEASTPRCVTLRPAEDPGEQRTVLLIGEFGNADDDPPMEVSIVGELASDDGRVSFTGTSVQVTPLAEGPSLVWAEVVPRDIWTQSGRGTRCPSTSAQVVRVTWAGGVRLGNREEPGDAERELYRVTVTQSDGSTKEVTPAAIADLGDNDNNHYLCLDTKAPATAVFFPGGHFVDPNNDLNPDSNIAIRRDVESQSDLQDVDSTMRPPRNPERNAYFGDLHVHTTNSFDAYTFGTISTPADAYRYAQGEAIMHPSGYEIQLSRPLDFYAVTDHAMFLGLLREAADTSSEFSKYELAEPLHNLNESVSNNILSIMRRAGLFRPFARAVNAGLEDGSIDRDLVERVGNTVWQETIKAADDAYEPGRFTTFAGYEYTSSVDLYEKYLHRNVIFRGTEGLPSRLFSRLDSQDPEKLWDWMDQLRSDGVDSLAIPHNSNISGGDAFSMNDYEGAPIDDAYARKRAMNEPLTEITQVKGTSETHPLLSPNDEWAEFEVRTAHEGENDESNLPGSYVRDAYLRGLTLAEQGITNPYKFGVIGASDTHVAATSDDEAAFFSKIGLLDGTPEMRGSVPFNRFYGTIAKFVRPNALAEVDGKDYLAVSPRLIRFSASGLAGVWAEENTREAIYDAFRRKETFATSGPRMKIRLFGGQELNGASLDDPGLISKAYATSTPMGGTVENTEGTRPSFLVWALADPFGASLQRLQIIKGWVEDGEHREAIYDVACSDGLSVDPVTHRCPDNGASVNLTDCSTSAHEAASELKVLWQDPDFEPGKEAFYYARVLENPVCRWSSWDAVRAGEKPRSDIPATIQERAWSSPIWLK